MGVLGRDPAAVDLERSSIGLPSFQHGGAKGQITTPQLGLRDADNLPKALLDLLVVHQVIQDDSKAVDVRTRWDASVPAGRVVVIVKSAVAMEVALEGT